MQKTCFYKTLQNGIIWTQSATRLCRKVLLLLPEVSYTASKSAAGLSPSSHQVDTRIHFHRLLWSAARQVCCKLSAGLLQVHCQNFVCISLMHAVSTTSSKYGLITLHQVWFSQAWWKWWSQQAWCNLTKYSRQAGGIRNLHPVRDVFDCAL